MATLRRFMGPDVQTPDDLSGNPDQPGAMPPEDPTRGDTGGAPKNVDAHGGETPRERVPGGGGDGAAITSTPRRPDVPTPMAGSPGVIPFPPMGGPSLGSLAMPHMGSLYGAQGGLKGGGLGVPLDPISDQASDPISGLIDLLTKLQGQH